MIDVRRQQESETETDSIGFAFNTTLLKEAESGQLIALNATASIQNLAPKKGFHPALT